MQNAEIILPNGSGVAKTFTPVLVSAEQVIFEDLTAATVAQRSRLTTTPGRFTRTRPTNKPSLMVEVPVIRGINTVNTVVSTIRVMIGAVYPVDATSQEISDAYAYAKHAMDEQIIQAQLRDNNYIT